ncbi:hypothetical protein [Streptomyces sp. NPDC006193]|uniref:hypothetical protein n=1 Tax=Streptomyces sp. NPDC006193 TaxID=3155717 RepID=UPI0033B3F155
MPRGRHRHSPPLHRLLPPSAIAGVSLVCALGPWVFSEVTVVRALAAAAAATAVTGAVVMRRWDTQAGRQVAELMRARAGDEWRFEERVAELETDLEESRELRTKLEQRLRAKRAELAGLRNEHAALLRRYATAETERASALEGRRLLELETAPESASEPGPAPSSPALPPGRAAGPEAADSADFEGPEEAGERVAEYAAFSPQGSGLYRRALAALARFDRGDGAAPAAYDVEPTPDAKPSPDAKPAPESRPGAVTGGEPRAASASGADGVPAAGTGGAEAPEGAAPEGTGPVAAEVPTAAARGTGEAAVSAAGAPPAPAGGPAGTAASAAPVPPSAGGSAGDRPAGRPAEGEAAAAAVTDGAGAAPAAEGAGAAGQPPAGHFTVPTAVAVVPAAPARRPVVEGGFDFFGTKKGTPKAALDSVQNEDLADVVGPEALAVHKAETEAGFKPADARSRGVGQVIDLTAHDETEHVRLRGLRSAAS